MLEIVVAIAVIGLLLVALLQGSRFVLSGWEMHARLAERNADLDAVDRTLRRLIEQARPGSKWENLLFVGTSRSIAFTSVLPARSGDSSPSRVDVELIVDADHRLLLRWTPHLHATRTGPPPQPLASEILRGVERLELSYRSATRPEGWTTVWHDPAPPQMVRIRIVFADPTHPRWPDILAAPMIGPS